MGTVPLHEAVADGCDGWVYLTNRLQTVGVTGIDDHSRFCVHHEADARATARPGL